jgi:cobalamin synthase
MIKQILDIINGIPDDVTYSGKTAKELMICVAEYCNIEYEILKTIYEERLKTAKQEVVPWNKKLNKPTKIIICVLILLALCIIGAVIQTCYVPKEYLTISRVIVSLVAFIAARIVYGKLGGNP